MDAKGRTPLHIAAAVGNLESVKELIGVCVCIRESAGGRGEQRAGGRGVGGRNWERNKRREGKRCEKVTTAVRG